MASILFEVHKSQAPASACVRAIEEQWNDYISSNLGLRNTFEGTFEGSDVDVDISSTKSW